MASRNEIITFKDLKNHGVPFGRRHIWTLEGQGKFPKHIKIGDRRIGWLAKEIKAYVDARIKARGA